MKHEVDYIALYELGMCAICLVILAHFHIKQLREERKKGKHDPNQTR